jgi:hypothetical protein
MMNLILFKKEICFLYINLIQIIKTYEKQSNSKRKKNLFLDLREWLCSSFENLLYKFCRGGYDKLVPGKIGGTLILT